MSSIFLSHSHNDKDFVNKLATDLRRAGYYVWTDDAEIKVGDSLINKIREGIDRVAYFGVVLSRNSINSEWVKKEVDIAMNQEIEGKRVKVLPILLDNIDLPGFLKGKKFADFRDDILYEKSLDEIIKRLDEVPSRKTEIPSDGSLKIVNREKVVKIKCIFKKNKPYVASWISMPNYQSKPVLFNINTGADVSLLSPIEAESMGIIVEQLPNPSPPFKLIGVVGTISNLELGLIKIYKLKFMSDNGWFEAYGENLIVLKNDFGYKFPSVLSVDFFTRLGFRLDFNLSMESESPTTLSPKMMLKIMDTKKK